MVLNWDVILRMSLGHFCSDVLMCYEISVFLHGDFFFVLCYCFLDKLYFYVIMSLLKLSVWRCL